MKFPHGTLLLASFGVLPACAQIPNFQHVIVIVQENRTPDNLFQGLCSPPYGSPNRCSVTPSHSQYNIQTKNWLNKNSASGITQPTPIALANKYDLGHAHEAFLAMCNAYANTNDCRMDGASDISCSGTCPPKPQFKFVDNSSGTVNPYLEMALQYGFANYMFQTNQGPSFPSHQFLFGGTSAPSARDDANSVFASENMSTASQQAGCEAPAGTTVQLITPAGEDPNNKVYPCFEHQTIPDLLHSAYTWRYYTPSAGSIWTAPNSIQHICQSSGPSGTCTGQEWKENVDLQPADVLKDIATCTLRNVNWVIPAGANSDHAKSNDGGGPSWVAAIVNAIGASTACDSETGYWQNTAILITWDDWGGWYDHEPPTILSNEQGDYQYGFRVPLLFLSAYTPAGSINNDRHDFGSVLRFIEHNFGIRQGALQFGDKRASNDFHLFYDLTAAPRSFTPIAAPKTAAFFLNDKRRATDPDDQ